MKKIWFFILCLGSIYFESLSQHVGRPLITNYSPQDYNAGSFNKMIIQDQRGILYVVNSKGILEYDGNDWRTLPIKNYIYQGAIAIDSSGLIYMSNNNDFGFLEPDNAGNLLFKSLMGLLKNEKPEDVAYIKQVYTTNHGIYFITMNSFYKYEQNTLKKITSTKSFYHIAYKVGNDIYVLENERGICKLVNDKFELIHKGELFKNDRLYAIFEYNENQLFIGTRSKGLFLYTLPSETKPAALNQYTSEANSFLKKFQLIHAIKSTAGDIILSTIQNGLIFIDKNGNITKHINTSSGLIDNFVRFLFIDQQQNLWMAASNGISKMSLNTPLTVWDKVNGLKGKVLKIIKPGNRLNILTSSGLFRFEKNRFVQMEDIGSYTWDMIALNNNAQKTKILAANNLGLFEFTNKKAQKVTDIKGTLSLCVNPNDSSLIFVGKQDGISVIKHENNSWIEKGQVKGIKKWIKSMQFDKENHLWLGTNFGEIIKLQFDQSSIFPQKIEMMTSQNNVPVVNKINIQQLADEVLFATENGLYHYISETKLFVPFPLFGEQFFDGSREVYNLVLGKNNSVWVSGSHTKEGGISILNETEQGFMEKTLNILPNMELESILSDEDNITWIGGSEGLFRYDEKLNATISKQQFNCLIRKVTLKNDSIVFYGTNYIEINTDSGKRKVANSQNLNEAVSQIEYYNNSVKFEFSATNFNNETKTNYQYFLEGYDNNWSRWSVSNTKEYTNLPFGDYKFRVKAKSNFGKESQDAVYYFTILTPLYASVWAIIAYILLIGIVVRLIIYYKTRSIEKEKEILEETVSKRTMEIVQQKEEIQSQAEKLYKSNLQIISQRDRIEQSYKDIHLLSEIGNQIIANLDINKIVETVFEKVNSLMDATEFGIGICNYDEEIISFKNYMFEGKVIPEVNVDMSNGNRLSVQCIKYGKEILLGDIQSEYKNYITSLENYKENELLNSVICVPLIIKDEVIGLIALQSHKINAYQNYHLNILKTIALYTGIAIDNANTFTKLESSYAELKELNVFKEAMTSMIVHDFKNALNTVISYSEGSFTEQKLESINAAGRHMLNMVLNMLDIQKFEEASLSLSLKKNPIHKVINDTIKQVSFLLEQKSIELTYRGEEVLFAKFDYEIIIRVLENIITNAIKHTPNNGKIEILTFSENSSLKVSIKDSGTGIPEDKLEAVFDKFFQVKENNLSSSHSSGLGLTFCKIAVEAHQGKIGVFSKLKEGSEFWFTLPLIAQKEITETYRKEKIEKYIPQEKIISLNEQDKEFLKPYIEELKNLDVYYFSDVMDILNNIDSNNNEPLTLWKQAISDSLTNINEVRYKELIQYVIPKNK